MRPELANQLRDMRLRCGLGQGELAARLGIDQSHVSRIESGRRDPAVDVLERWAAACEHKVCLVPLAAADRLPGAQKDLLRRIEEVMGLVQPSQMSILEAVVGAMEAGRAGLP